MLLSHWKQDALHIKNFKIFPLKRSLNARFSMSFMLNKNLIEKKRKDFIFFLWNWYFLHWKTYMNSFIWKYLSFTYILFNLVLFYRKKIPCAILCGKASGNGKTKLQTSRNRWNPTVGWIEVNFDITENFNFMCCAKVAFKKLESFDSFPRSKKVL